jgi:hypothetical protein
MSRRIEVELTSSREDGTWTWRAAGAKQPKGDLDGSLLYDGAKVGDVVRADADFLMDGIVIVAVLPPKGARKEPERLEIIGPPRREDQLVTTHLAPKGRGGRDGDRRPRRDGDRDRPGRPGGDRDGRPGGDRERRPRREGDKPSGERRERPARPPRPAPEPKPKPKRLRAGRTHRNEVLATLPEEQKPVAEQVLKGGIPAVRQAVEKQNETNKAEGKPEINEAPLVALAEQIMPALRTAEWRDKAEAALAEMAELDLRDLRSVVVAADVAARDEETRELAEKLRTGLTERVDAEHTAWLAEIDETLTSGRVVRALRVSSRPPKAGTPFPAELATRLTEETAKSLTADTGTDRYATVLDALAYSPVRGQVTPEGIPAEPGDELLAAVKKLASRLPKIATLFGIEAPSAPAKGRGRPKGKGPKAGPAKPGQAKLPPPPPGGVGSKPPAPTPALPTGDAPAAALDAGEQPVAAIEAPAEATPTESTPVEAPVEAPAAEVTPVEAAPAEPETPAADETTPTESAPVEAPAAEATPVEAAPVEAAPAVPETPAADEAPAEPAVAEPVAETPTEAAPTSDDVPEPAPAPTESAESTEGQPEV